jgi:hypothetical protein
MYFLDSKMAVISSNIQINSSYYEYIKIKNAIGVLNFAYFEKASIQIKHSLTKPGFITPTSMQSTLFSIYNKLIREHQIMFLLFNIFENALRSKAAILITEYFSTKGTDDWYIDKTKIDKDLKKPVETALIKLTNDGHTSRSRILNNIRTRNELNLTRHFFTEINASGNLKTIDPPIQYK